MPEITSSGYQDVRDYIVATWKYIEIRGADGITPLVRLQLAPADVRVNWTHVGGAQTLEMTVVLKGTDGDFAPTKTVAGSALFKVATGGNALSEGTFAPFTIGNTQDVLTIVHQIQVPQV